MEQLKKMEYESIKQLCEHLLHVKSKYKVIEELIKKIENVICTNEDLYEICFLLTCIRKKYFYIIVIDTPGFNNKKSNLEAFVLWKFDVHNKRIVILLKRLENYVNYYKGFEKYNLNHVNVYGSNSFFKLIE